MSPISNSTAPNVDSDVHETLYVLQEQMRQQQACLQKQLHLMQQQQAEIQELRGRIQQLEYESNEHDGGQGYKNPRATVIKLHPKLLEVYPAIAKPKFFDSELPKNHNVFDWNDYHFTEGMNYKPPPVMPHSEVVLKGPAKRHERDLITIQGYLAQTTRFYDTFAHKIVSSGESDSALGKRVLSFLNTVRILASHDASRISRMRENLYLDELGLNHGKGTTRRIKRA